MALQRVLGQPVEDPRSASRHSLGRAPPRLIMARRAAPTHSAPSFRTKGGLRCRTTWCKPPIRPEAWSGLVKNPQNRLEAVRPVVEKLGGKIEGGWLAFGEYDIVLVCQMPKRQRDGVLDGRVGGWGGQGGQDDAAH